MDKSSGGLSTKIQVADACIDTIEAGEAIVVIPLKKSRKTAREYDENL